MDKESIYQLIGYQGEYSNSVKKALRQLLKEHHPDHQGDAFEFQLINEVKKELETNKVTYKVRKKGEIKKYDGINYDFCYQKIDEITKEITILKRELNKKKTLQTSYNAEYNQLYRESIMLEEELLNSKSELFKTNKIKRNCLVTLCILTIIFVLSIIKKNTILLFVFAIGSFFLFYQLTNLFQVIRLMSKQNKKSVKTYVKNMKDIEDIKNRQEKIKGSINNVERKIARKENDLRFYINLTK